MKKLFETLAISLSILLVLQSCGGGKEVAGGSSVKDHTDSVNYAIGCKTGGNFKRDKIEIREELLKKGLSQGLSGGTEQIPLKDLSDSANFGIGKKMASTLVNMKFEVRENLIVAGFIDQKNEKPLFTEEITDKILSNFQQFQMEKVASDNKKKGMAFLEQNKGAEGIIITPSGIQYRILKTGKGPSPKLSDKVTCNYTGTTIDGSKFDSSNDHGGPATFNLNRVISGWQEVLQLMKIGDSWEIWIPSDLAYGMNAPPNIGPNQVLKFEIELLKFAPGDGDQPPPPPPHGR